MNADIFLLLNLALSFYLVGAIWAHEIDIFRSWKLISAKDFAKVQTLHWRKLPYWIFTLLGLALMGSSALIWYYPPGSTNWGNLGELGLSTHVPSAHGDLLGKVASGTGEGRARSGESVFDEDPGDPLDTIAPDQCLWHDTSGLGDSCARLSYIEVVDE